MAARRVVLGRFIDEFVKFWYYLRAMARTATSTRSTRTKAPTSIRTYRSALSFLDSVTNFENMTRVSYNTNNFNTARMTRLLSALGNPHRSLKCVHIAGTKGKGSTAVMLASMLSSGGLKVGMYTSPHLIDVRERVQINGEMIPEADMIRLMSKIAPIVRKKAKDQPTYFEIMTALAFLYFSEAEVDIAVIETGLGGRLDSTNVIKPVACAITSISLDHQAQLGNTLAKIAEEKAGIFKPGVPIVSCPQPQSKKVRVAAAEKVKSPIYFTGKDSEFSYRFESSRVQGPHIRVCLTRNGMRFDHVPVPLPGDHQAVNCGIALALLAILKEQGFEVDDQRATEGLSKAYLPGRMETINEHPHIIVDGAHNASSVEALMRAIGQNVTYDSMVVIFGCRSDKDIPGMMNHIQLGADKVIFTPTGAPRTADPQELAAEYMERSGKTAQIASSLDEALDIAERAVTREDVICICGSFRLAGRAKLRVAERYKSDELAVAGS